MNYEFDISQQSICIEDHFFHKKDFSEQSPTSFFESEELKKVYSFLHEWFNEVSFVWVKTSGSTGRPKSIRADKQKMMQSAAMTCSFLHLQQGDKALLCMNLNYIGAKMVIVRSLITGMRLFVRPATGHPLADVDTSLDFAAFVPLQVFNSLQIDKEKERIKHIKKLIIGGGAIEPQMAEVLKTFPNEVYSTYGMTETLSHIALRKLSGQDASDYYTPLEGVSLSLSGTGSLCINAPKVANETLITNDIAELRPDQSFRILGRTDNIINSGGIKIQIEEMEKILRPLLGDTFAITSLPDPKFGEIVVLVTTSEIKESNWKELLPTYCYPKRVILMDVLPLTETGKIRRKELKEIIITRYSSGI